MNEFLTHRGSSSDLKDFISESLTQDTSDNCGIFWKSTSTHVLGLVSINNVTQSSLVLNNEGGHVVRCSVYVKAMSEAENVRLSLSVSDPVSDCPFAQPTRARITKANRQPRAGLIVCLDIASLSCQELLGINEYTRLEIRTQAYRIFFQWLHGLARPVLNLD